MKLSGIAAILCSLVLCLAAPVAAHLARTTQSVATSDDEFAVYNAVMSLMQFPKKNVRVTIYDTTLNFKCGEESGNPTLANGCSFLAMPPTTPDEIESMLRQQCPDLSRSAWADFVAKNQASVTLKDSFVAPWQHRLVGKDIADDGAKEWASPDLTLFVSRIGFDGNRTEAIVYFLSFSYMQHVTTGGDYFVLRLAKDKKWNPVGRLRYFDMGETGSASVRHATASQPLRKQRSLA